MEIDTQDNGSKRRKFHIFRLTRKTDSESESDSDAYGSIQLRRRPPTTTTAPGYSTISTAKYASVNTNVTHVEDSLSDDIKLATNVPNSTKPKPNSQPTIANKEAVLSPMEIAPLTETKATPPRPSDSNKTSKGNLCDGYGRFWIIVSAVIVGIGILLTVILIPVSIRKVDYDQFGIRYDDLTKKTYTNEYGEGRYVFTPQTKMFLYDALIQKDDIAITCLTKDGVVVQLVIHLQYAIARDAIIDIWNEFGKEAQIEEYLQLVASDAVRDTISTYKAQQFYSERYSIQVGLEENVRRAMNESQTHLTLVTVVLETYRFPNELRQAIEDKREAEMAIVLAENERDGVIIEAETKYIVSKVYAQQLKIEAEAEVQSMLIEANATATAMEAKYGFIQELFVKNMRENNFTSKQFIESWLRSFVLLNAEGPITSTLDDHEFEFMDVFRTTAAPNTTSVDMINGTSPP